MTKIKSPLIAIALFTFISNDGKSYQWSFGDGATSTSEKVYLMVTGYYSYTTGTFAIRYN